MVIEQNIVTPFDPKIDGPRALVVKGYFVDAAGERRELEKHEATNDGVLFAFKPEELTYGQKIVFEVLPEPTGPRPLYDNPQGSFLP